LPAREEEREINCGCETQDESRVGGVHADAHGPQGKKNRSPGAKRDHNPGRQA
jgi:hypothetical protein